jgi:mono/diheme cytochrome c family protein
MRLLVAATGPAQIGVVLAIAVVLFWLGYIVVTNLRPSESAGSESQLAANRRPYFTDEVLEGPKLDRTLTWSLLSLGFIALALPLYWLREPGRQDGAVRGFDHRAAHRGEELFASATAPEHPGLGCADCHGPEGVGGSTSYTVQIPADDERNTSGEAEFYKGAWTAPPLNTVLLRFSEEEVHDILVYGRPGTPMPPWGVDGGGPLNAQGISDLLAYLHEIQLTPAEAKEASTTALETAKADGAVDDEGKFLFEANCARCHTKGWSYRTVYEEPDALPGGGGSRGPNLRDGATLRQFPDEATHVEFVTTGSDSEASYGVGGVGSGRMPGFGEMLTEDQIKAIVEYERSL